MKRDSRGGGGSDAPMADDIRLVMPEIAKFPKTVSLSLLANAF